MNILIYDAVQDSEITTGSESIKTPSLRDISTDLSYTIEFDTVQTINCIGLGNISYLQTGVIPSTFKIEITINQTGGVSTTETLTSIAAISGVAWEGNEFQYLNFSYDNVESVDIVITEGDGTFYYVGRIALGQYRKLPIYKAREPAFKTTTQNKLSQGGHVIESLGGVTKRVFNVELKANITEDIFQDFTDARFQLPYKFPYFIDFTHETQWIDYIQNSAYRHVFYGVDNNDMTFQSSFKGFIYSKKFQFEEAF